MRGSRTGRWWMVVAAILVLGAAAGLPCGLAAKDFVKPEARAAINYPAHDFHRDEQVAFAADPYNTPEKGKLFPLDFLESGFLPIFFVVTNDGDQPVSIANIEITFFTANHSKLTPISLEDVYRRMSNPQNNTRPSPLPIPLPHKKPKGTLSKKQMDDIASSQFAARAVEPHTTQSGFLFFDVGGISSPLPGANIDITGVENAKGAELMYFEISIDKYLGAPANP